MTRHEADALSDIISALRRRHYPKALALALKLHNAALDEFDREDRANTQEAQRNV